MPDWIVFGPAPWLALLTLAVVVLFLNEARTARSMRRRRHLTGMTEGQVERTLWPHNSRRRFP